MSAAAFSYPLRLSAKQKKAVVSCLTDPVAFAKHFLQADLWVRQEEILAAIAKPNSRTACKACHASSKCVAASDYITLIGGKRVQAGDLVGQTFQLPSLNSVGGHISVRARAEWNCTEPVFSLETESGKRIVRNAHHPLWVANGVFPAGRHPTIDPLGWTPLEDIKVGQLVAVAETLEVFGDHHLDSNELKLLAYLIGDGGYTSRGVTFTKLPGPQLDEFTECAESIGCNVVATGQGCDHRITGDNVYKRTSVCPTSQSGFITHAVNPVIDLLRRHGLMGKGAREKRVPSVVFGLSREQIALFLSRLYGTDGCAIAGAAPTIGYSSTSLGLIEDIQHLLLRFGVAGRIQVCDQIVSGRPYRSWNLVVHFSADVVWFCDQIGIYGKEKAVAACRERAEQQLNSRQRRVWRWKKSPPGTRWERVKSVSLSGIEPTVAIEVPKHHTYLTSFWEHNTFTAADAALWMLASYKDCIVVTTAPTATQMEKLLWGEIHAALNKSVYPFPPSLNTELHMGPRRYAFGRTTSVTKQDEGIKFQGIHADHVLVIIDEAPGVDPKIWDAIDGIRAGGDVRVLALGNPTISSGKFHDIFHGAAGDWNLFSISAFDTPNLAGLTLEQLLELPEEDLDKNPRPYLTTRRWVKEKWFEWGVGHPLWESRVLGQFPSMDESALISLSWLEQAKLRDLPAVGKISAGLDVAGPGEAETVLVIRQGPQVLALRFWSKPDPRGEVLNALEPYVQPMCESRGSVNVDTAGIGYYLAKHLSDHKIPVTEVNVGESPRDSEHYSNLKAELYWGLRMRIQAGDFSGLTDERAIGQLAGIRWKTNARGQVVIESKEDACKRGVKSPDRAEAVMLAFAEPKVYGLFDLYREQAAAVARGEDPFARKEPARPVPGAVHPLVAARELANAQKEGADFMTSTKKLGKIATTKDPPQTDVCPKCNNPFPARFRESSKCNACGHSWPSKISV